VISVEAVAYSSYCNTVEWFWWDSSLSQWSTGFLQCFDDVDWVIWPVKMVSDMTYKVSSGTLSLYSLTHSRTMQCTLFSHERAEQRWSKCFNSVHFCDSFIPVITPIEDCVQLCCFKRIYRPTAEN